MMPEPEQQTLLDFSSSDLPDDILSVKAAASALGVTHIHVRRLIRSGRLAAASRGPYVIRRSAIEQYQQRSLVNTGGRKSTHEAAAMLGITKWGVLGWIRKGLLKADRIAGEKGGRAWYITPEEIERMRLVRHGKRYVVRPRPAEDGWIGNRKVSALIGRSPNTAYRIMSDGTLPGAEKRNGQWMVQRAKVERYLADRRVPKSRPEPLRQHGGQGPARQRGRCDPMTLCQDRKNRIKSHSHWTEKTVLKSWLARDLWDKITSCSQDEGLLDEIAATFGLSADNLSPTLCFVLEPGNGQRFAAMMPGTEEHLSMKKTQIREIAAKESIA